VKNHPGLYPSGSSKRKHVDSHATVERDPEALLQNWLQPIKAGSLAGLAPSEESKAEAEKFLQWLKARKEYANNTLHAFLEEFRRFAAFLNSKGRGMRDFTYEDYIEFSSKATHRRPLSPFGSS